MSRPPHPLDLAAARRLRDLRVLKGMTQESLADAVGLSFQMIQKYERGTVRMAVSRAILLAEALGANPHALMPPGPPLPPIDGKTHALLAVFAALPKPAQNNLLAFLAALDVRP